MNKKQLEDLKSILEEYIRKADYGSKSHTASQLLKLVEELSASRDDKK